MNLLKQIQIYGDSVMKGVLLDQNSRYCTVGDENLRLIQSEFPLAIQNKAKFGCTVTKGLEQLKRAAERGLSCDMVLLEYGGNDCDYNWEEVAANPSGDHQPHTPLPLFEKTYREMLALLKEKGVTPILMSLPPIDAEKYLNWITRDGLSKTNILRWLGDMQMIYRFQELYSRTAERIAQQTQTLFVDVRSAFLSGHDFKSLICEDGIHPSEKGHEILTEEFSRFAAGYFAAQSRE